MPKILFLITFVSVKTNVKASGVSPVTSGKEKRPLIPRWRRLMRSFIKVALPLGISIGLCWALLRDVNINEMIDIVKTQCDFRYILLMLAVSLLPILFRAIRWGIQLSAAGIKVPLHILVYSIFGTYSINILFPRLGEVWRSGYIAYRQHAPFSEVFGSMVADRLSDTVVVILVTLFTLLVAYEPIENFVRTYPAAYQAIAHVMSSPWLWGGLALFIGGFWCLLRYSHNSKVLKIKKFLTGLWDGFAAIFHMKHKAMWLLLTVLIWGCYYIQLYIAFFAFPFTRELLAHNGPLVVLVCYVLTSIAMGIPSQGGIGPYQATMLFGLRVFAPAAAVATVAGAAEFRTAGAAFGNLLIASQTAFVILYGIVVFILIAIDKHRNPDGASRIPAGSAESKSLQEKLP